jgi:thiol-disulfide isomerase/thioredoxin
MFKKIIFSLFLCFTFTSNAQGKISLKSSVPEFKLWLLNDAIITKENLKDKVVVLKFWFTTCTPCIEDIPKMNSLVNIYSNRKDILFIAPALDRKKPIEKLIKKIPFEFKIAYNSMDVSQVFNKKQVYPSYFVIDKKGKFVFIDSGSQKSNFNDLKSAVEKALEM